jgi:predicted nucleic acid-binding protein
MIVVDSNIITYLHLAGPRLEEARHLFRFDPQWAAPRLWRSEFRNVLAMYVRRGLLTLAAAQGIMDEALRVMNGREYEVASSAVLRLAAGSSCSAYDCEFVALAQDLGVPLVTVDQQVLDEFPHLAATPDRYLASRGE